MGKWTQKSSKHTQSSVENDLFLSLTPLEDTLEWKAHAFILERLGLYHAAIDALRTYNDVGTILRMPKKHVNSKVNESI